MKQALIDQPSSELSRTGIGQSLEASVDSISGPDGNSWSIEQVRRVIRNVARTDANVLIQGETGTGKERVARALHQGSRRHAQPFVVLDCASIPDTLLESALFGHEKGSFTGAAAAKPGLFELADGGTLFLDEIGEIPLHLQAKLLRAVQEQCFYRIGGVREIRVDVRILAATNRNLDEAVHRGIFREDLYYRLKVITIEVPPLRQRREDIPLLANIFLGHFAARHHKRILGITPNAVHCLVNHSWQGNIRQLENVIERSVVLAEKEYIDKTDLPDEVLRDIPNQSLPVQQVNLLSNASELPTLKIYRESRLLEIEGEYALRLLQHTRGNVSAAARMAGISTRSFYRLMKRCQLQTEQLDIIRLSTETSEVTWDSNDSSDKLNESRQLGDQ